MLPKVHRVSGRKDVNLLRFFLYIFLILLGLFVLHHDGSHSTIDNITSNLEENKGNTSSYQYNWLSYLWSQPDKETALEQIPCNFEDYIFRQRVQQTDPCLIATVKKNIILPPPPAHEQNNSTLSEDGEIESNIEKYKWIEKFLIEDNAGNQNDSRWPGFFIELGANDGKFISTTIRLERNHKWTGLLIEASPIPFKKLLELKRNTWAANVAACTTEYPNQVTFFTDPSDLNTGLAGLQLVPDRGVTAKFTVQCIPLYTMLAALEVDIVDYLSLDVEGFELAVLETIPFDKVRFKVMTIEYDHIPGRQEALRTFLEPKGYRFVKEINDYWTKDCLYVHESLYERALQVKI